MRIEALETFLHGRERFTAGDIRTVDDELGAYFCKAGWAKDLDGNTPTGDRDTREVILAPDGAHSDHEGEGV